MALKYALVIGGTGMLKKVCYWLSEQKYDVYVIGRNQTKMGGLKQDSNYPERIHGISVDYGNSGQFEVALTNLLRSKGIPKIVISWIHSTAPNALPLVKDMINSQDLNVKWQLFHIQGSARFFQKENTPVPKNCLCRRVYLGFIIQNNHSRWLTHDEIANGVIRAIKSGLDETIVGTLEPWELRP